MKGGAGAEETLKFPTLKFNAGLAASPNPPKLNPVVLEVAESSPPNPDEWEA